MTLKIQKSANDGFVILTLSGRIQTEHLAELKDLFDLESTNRRIVLDLKEVKLVDREAVMFLMRCKGAGIGLKNCPAYIREWIRKEVERR